MKDTRFFKQADLLLQLLPFFSKNNIFAIKGGTAINFFIRDLPRLSVDIDLAYLPINDREKAIAVPWPKRHGVRERKWRRRAVPYFPFVE